MSTSPTHHENNNDVRSKVMEGYAHLASGKPKSCCSKMACRSGTTETNFDDFANKVLHYSATELTALPEGANMGLSCGNPTAIANLKKGEVVLDLGCGGGFDVFLAARKIGPCGASIGVDMTPPMLKKARANTVQFEARHPHLTGVAEFRLGEIEHLPVADSSVDVVISNCVVNLSPDKPQVWREVGRVLKPGGRACVSDIALIKPLPDSLKQSVSALVGCVAGAVPIEETVCMVEEAGLFVINAERETVFVHNMETSDDPLYKDIMDQFPPDDGPRNYVTSLKLVASKATE